MMSFLQIQFPFTLPLLCHLLTVLLCDEKQEAKNDYYEGPVFVPLWVRAAVIFLVASFNCSEINHSGGLLKKQMKKVDEDHFSVWHDDIK